MVKTTHFGRTEKTKTLRIFDRLARLFIKLARLFILPLLAIKRVYLRNIKEIILANARKHFTFSNVIKISNNWICLNHY